MVVLSLFKAGYPYNRSPHGILMRYLQNFRYLSFVIAVIWTILMFIWKSFERDFSLSALSALLIAGFVYLLAAEWIMFLVYSRALRFGDRVVLFFAVADVVFSSAGVYLSGGIVSPFLLLYLLALVNCRIVYGAKYGLIVTMICLGTYLGAVMASPGYHPLKPFNFAAIILPLYFAFSHYVGIMTRLESNTKREKDVLDQEYRKSKLLYRFSKELNQAREYHTICDLLFETIDPVVPVKGMKVFFGCGDNGVCSEIYSYESEQVDWGVELGFETGEELGPEILKNLQYDFGFFILPLGNKAESGIIIIRGQRDYLQADYYERYFKTVAEIAAAGFRNVAHLKRLEMQSASDGLTGLFNNAYFYRHLGEMVKKTERYHLKFVVAMMDLDYFKKINDRYGHIFGDMVLKELAVLVRDKVRVSDLAARYGGEEFAVIMPHTDLTGAYQLMERLRSTVEAHVFQHKGDSCKMTLSIGLAAWKPPMGVKEIVKIADDALYMAKGSGRNRVVCYGPHESGVNIKKNIG